MSDTEHGAAPDGMSAGEQPQGETPPEWFRQFQQEITGRLGKLTEDVISVRKKATKQEPKEAASEKPPAPSLTKEDLDAAMRLGEVQSRLPEETRKHVQQFVEQRGHVLALEVAKLLADSLAPAGETPAALGERPVTGQAGMAPTNRGVQYPRTIPELREIMLTDPKRYEQLKKDPRFDPTILPRS